jgi:hypothetical protein
MVGESTTPENPARAVGSDVPLHLDPALAAMKRPRRFAGDQTTLPKGCFLIRKPKPCIPA